VNQANPTDEQLALHVPYKTRAIFPVGISDYLNRVHINPSACKIFV
jgi:hypothetical protein